MKSIWLTIVAVAMTMFAGSSWAQVPVLTPEGIARGFKFTVLASNFPDAQTVFHDPGATGVLFTNSGLLVTDGSDDSVRLFPKDCDGQDASKNPPTAYYAVGAGGPFGKAQAHLDGKPHYYLVTAASEVFEINSDGTPIQKIVTIPGDFQLTGVSGDPLADVLLVTAPICDNDHTGGCPGGIFVVSPSSKTSSEAAPGFFVADIYLDSNGHIFIVFLGFATIEFNLSDFSIVAEFPLTAGVVGGSVLGTGALADHIFQMDGNGDLWEEKLDGSDLTMIATDVNVSLGIPDPHNGSLVFANFDTVVRLSGGGLASDDGETQVNSCTGK